MFGLSHGLYQSFLATGGTSTKDFAKAIAIAFDNTLLGLALTIILFAVQSLLRKREESLLLQLNLQVGVASQSEADEGVNEGLSSLAEVMRAHNSTLLGHQQELVDLRQTLQDPVAQLATRVSRSVEEGLSTIWRSAAEQNKMIVADMVAAFSQQLSLVSQQLIISTTDRLKEEMRRPRTFQVLESPGPDGNN